MQHRRLLRDIAVLTLFVAGMQACAGDSISAPRTPRIDKELLTGRAADALNEKGQFNLDLSLSSDELSESEAVGFATIFLADYGRFSKTRYELSFGGTINLSRLKACPRAFYAASAYQYKDVIAPQLTRELGPHWLVSFCTAGGIPAVSVSLSALAKDLVILEDVLRMPHPGPGDFLDVGIPRYVENVPIAPEDAARIAAIAAGALVAEVPQLVQTPRPYAPQLARWRIRLDREIAVRGAVGGKTYRTRELYVGFDKQFGPTEILYGELASSITAPVEFEIVDPDSRAHTFVPVRLVEGIPVTAERVLPQ